MESEDETPAERNQPDEETPTHEPDEAQAPAAGQPTEEPGDRDATSTALEQATYTKAELAARAAAFAPGQDLVDVKRLARDAFRSGHDRADLALLMSQARQTTGLPQKVVDVILEEARRHLEGHGLLDGPGQVAAAMKAFIEKHYGPIVYDEGNFHVYHGDPGSEFHGTFVHVEREELQDAMMEVCPPEAVDSAAKRNEAERHLQRLVRMREAFHGSASGIALRDVALILDPTTWVLKPMPHSPDHRLRNKIDVNYNPAATCDRFCAAIDRVLDGDEQATAAYLVFLACVAFRVRLPFDLVRTCLLLYGPPRTGKSTLIWLLQQFVHPRLVVSISPARMGRPENLADLAHAQLNIQTELPGTQPLPTDIIKKIASGERVEGRRMRQDPFSFEPFVFMGWAANQLPRFRDADDGSILRRLVILAMGKPLSDAEAAGDFAALVEDEKAGIINLLAAKFREACEAGRFPLPANQEELGAELLHGGDLVLLFIRLHVERRPGARLWKIDLEKALRAFYRTHDAYYPDNDYGLMRRASEAMKASYSALHRTSGGKPFYDGVVLRGTELSAPVLPPTTPADLGGAVDPVRESTLEDMN